MPGFALGAARRFWGNMRLRRKMLTVYGLLHQLNGPSRRKERINRARALCIDATAAHDHVLQIYPPTRHPHTPSPTHAPTPQHKNTKEYEKHEKNKVCLKR
jgi:hypothetical protein